LCFVTYIPLKRRKMPLEKWVELYTKMIEKGGK